MPPTPPAKPRAHRLFLAIWPDDPVRQAVAEHADAWSLPAGCLRYGPADWHVTLHFLGRVETERVPDIAAAVDVPTEPFRMVLDQPLLWPGGLAVVGASEMPQALKALHDRLAQALRGVNHAVESRPYRPHLTLARRAFGARRPRAPVPVQWPVRGFALVVSTGKADQRYALLRTYGN
jgi:2'-5' RNA ligase